MFICPDCRSELNKIGTKCINCNWEVRYSLDIPSYLSSKDRSNPQFTDYMNIYDELAEKNVKEPTLSNCYVDHLAKQFISGMDSLKNKQFCDIGAGRGYLIKYAMLQKPKSITAIDISSLSLKNIKDKYTDARVILANAENIPFEEEFDVITATDIIEHVLNLPNFFVSSNKALRNNGIIAIRVPYKENLLPYSNYFGLPVSYTHLRAFTKNLLIETIKHYGFKVIKCSYNGFLTIKMRDLWLKIPYFGNKLPNFINKFFNSPENVTTINPVIGRILMKPIELSVIAQKVKTLEFVNLYEKWWNFRKKINSVQL